MTAFRQGDRGGQDLLFTDNEPKNPFNCMVDSDLFLPKDWSEDRVRCREAGIPDELMHRPKWQIAVDQLEGAIGNGIRFGWVTFDEDYGQIPKLWFELDRLGLRGVGEVRKDFRCWATVPHCKSFRYEHASKRVDNTCRQSPVFTSQKWSRLTIKNTTRGWQEWEVKSA